MMQDYIDISGIRSYGYIGVFPEEQVLGQWFEVDLRLEIDLAKAGRSDRLEDTLNYAAVIMLVQTLLQTARYALLERMATEIADRILALPDQPPLTAVLVKLTKLTAPIPGFSGRVAVELNRRRPPK